MSTLLSILASTAWLTFLILKNRKDIKMAVTRAEFDQKLQDGVNTIVTAITDLKAEVAAGNVTTPEDFQAELDTLTTGVQAAFSADPGPQSGSGSTVTSGDGSTPAQS